VKHIKALLDFARTTPAKLLARGRVVLTGLYAHPAYANPPVEKSALESALDRLQEVNTEVLDRGKKAFAEQKKHVALVVEMLRELAHYVQFACKGNMETFLSSGFEPAPTKRTQTPPLTEAIRKIVTGGSGEALITLVCDPEARAYQVRWIADGIEPTDDAFSSQHIGTTRPATRIKNLTPGTIYRFQVRSVRSFDTGPWSDPVTYICT
jgi:hypothetical protein